MQVKLRVARRCRRWVAVWHLLFRKSTASSQALRIASPPPADIAFHRPPPDIGLFTANLPVNPPQSSAHLVFWLAHVRHTPMTHNLLCHSRIPRPDLSCMRSAPVPRTYVFRRVLLPPDLASTLPSKRPIHPLRASHYPVGTSGSLEPSQTRLDDAWCA